MKAIRIFLVIFISLIPSFLLAVETETVGKTTYNWYETTWDKDDIFTQAGLLDLVGIGQGDKKVAKNIGDINLETIAGSYGGVLLWASHGIYDQGLTGRNNGCNKDYFRGIYPKREEGLG